MGARGKKISNVTADVVLGPGFHLSCFLVRKQGASGGCNRAVIPVSPHGFPT